MGKQLIVLALLTSPAWATWSLAQAVANQGGTGCTGTPTACSVTVASTGTGHGIIVAIATSNSTAVTISSVSGGAGTFTHCSNCSIFGATTGSMDMSYTTASTSGSTTITLNLSAAASAPIGMVWEFSSTTTFAFDASNSISDATCTACAGATLALTGSNDFIAGGAACGSSCTGVTGTGWTNDNSNPGGDAQAHGLNVSTGTMTFTQASNILRASAVAFKETGGAVACNNHIALMGAGCN